MSKLSAADIERLCDNWCAASVTPKGGTGIGTNTEQFRLLANEVEFHELSHEALCTAVVGLSQVLLRPNLSSYVSTDHYFLWSWCGELLLNPLWGLFPQEQFEIRSLYATSVHAALADCCKPPETHEEDQSQRLIKDLQPHHAKQLTQQSSVVLAYLGFPLLEAVLKRACAAYVAFDGKVISAFSVLGKNGNSALYDPKRSKGKKHICSSLRDLLFLHYEKIASAQQKVLIDRFRAHLALLDGNQDPFDLVYGWRNQSLHGSTNFHTIGGTMLNLSFLFSLFEIEHEFEAYRQRACDLFPHTAHRFPSSFYPPY